MSAQQQSERAAIATERVPQLEKEVYNLRQKLRRAEWDRDRYAHEAARARDELAGVALPWRR